MQRVHNVHHTRTETLVLTLLLSDTHLEDTPLLVDEVRVCVCLCGWVSLRETKRGRKGEREGEGTNRRRTHPVSDMCLPTTKVACPFCRENAFNLFAKVFTK